MKINFCSSEDITNGYVNFVNGELKAIPEVNSETRVIPIHTAKMDDVLQGQSPEEIVVSYPLNTIDVNDMPGILGQFIGYLKDGILRVHFNDIFAIAENIITGKANLYDTHIAIYGDSTPCRVIMNTELAKKLIEDAGGKIKSITRDGYIVSLEVTKVNEDIV